MLAKESVVPEHQCQPAGQQLLEPLCSTGPFPVVWRGLAGKGAGAAGGK